MRSAWTGGQYSLFRALLGATLAVHFARLVPLGRALAADRDAARRLVLGLPRLAAPWELPEFATPAVVSAVLLLGAALGVALAAGARDRLAAVSLAALTAGLLGRDPLAPAATQVAVVFLCAAHALLPPAPFGSWRARGRVDPGGGWSMDRRVHLAAWVVLAAAYGGGGAAKLADAAWIDGSALAPAPRLATWSVVVVQLLFAPLALLRAARAGIWSATLAVHLAVAVPLESAALDPALVLVHLLAFDPAWLAPRAGAQERVFYDGTCGLCHGFVRFVLAEDRAAAFRFAALGGEAFRRAVPAAERDALPDTIVVRTTAGRVLVRSAAIVHVLDRLGGAWRVLAALLRLVPRPARDAGYDLVAAVRHRLFRSPDGACPLIPPDLARRFDA